MWSNPGVKLSTNITKW